MPIDTAQAVVAANSRTVRPPTDPSRRGSARAVTPDAIDTNTIGTTSMRISRTNSSPMNAIPGAAAGQNSPSSTPMTSPPTTRRHSGMANQRRAGPIVKARPRSPPAPASDSPPRR